jgi:hypothetical protein
MFWDKVAGVYDIFTNIINTSDLMCSDSGSDTTDR